MASILTTQRENLIQYISSNGENDPWRDKIPAPTRYKYRQQALKCEVRDGRLFCKRKEVLSADDIAKVISEAYNDPGQGFISPIRLYEKLSDQYANIRLEDCLSVVKKDPTYQIHRRVFNVKGRSNTQNVDDVLSLIEIDLIGPMHKPAANKNMHYVLNAVDVVSKFLWSIPIKNKEAKTVADALELVLINIEAIKLSQEKEGHALTSRLRIRSDRGLEFVNNQMKDMLEKHNAIHVLSEAHRPESNGIVERTNQTLKNMLYRYMTAHKTNNWLAAHEQIVRNYNSNTHSTTKEAPIDTINHETSSGNAIQAISDHNDVVKAQDILRFPEISIGDKVRIVKPINERQQVNVTRGYLPQWGDDVFEVYRLIAKGTPNERYLIQDDANYYSQRYRRDQLLKI